MGIFTGMEKDQDYPYKFTREEYEWEKKTVWNAAIVHCMRLVSEANTNDKQTLVYILSEAKK